MTYKYLVLGLLAKEPMTGYDIWKHVDDNLYVVTGVSFGTLYPTLHRLYEAGAIYLEQAEQENPLQKKVYAITDQGRDELETWLHESSGDGKIQREFLLKLYLAERISGGDVRRLLEDRRQATLASLARVEQDRENYESEGHHWLLLFARSQYHAELTWLDEIEDMI